MSASAVRWSAAALYVLAVLLMGVRAGQPDQAWWWLGEIPFTAWIASPILAGLFFHSRFGNETARLAFAILLAAIAVAGFALQWHVLFIGPSDAQNGLVALFAPLYQWFGVLLSLALCWLGGKLMRRGNVPTAGEQKR